MKLILFLPILFLNFVYADPSEAGDQAVQAILEGDTNRVTSLLAVEGVDVNFTDSHQHSLLHHAVTVGNIDMVQLLVAHGADLSAKDRFGKTALDMARFFRNSRIISVLESAIQETTPSEDSFQGVKDVPVQASQTQEDDSVGHLRKRKVQKTNSALLTAIIQGNVLTLKSLLSNGGNRYINEVFVDEIEHLLLHTAIRLYVESNKDEFLQQYGQQMTDLENKIRKEVIEVLINFGADVNSVLEGIKDTPLTIAITGDLPEIIALLLEKGADPNLSPDKTVAFSPLYLALGKKRNLGWASMLLDHKADINFQYGKFFILEALIINYTQEDLPAIVFALNHGADLDKSAAFHYIVKKKDLKMIQLFLEHEANLNLDEALASALRQKDLQMIQLFLEHGANLNLEEALKSAVLHTDLQMAQLLLDHGDNLNLEEALQTAVRQKNLQMAQLLLDHGDNLNLEEALQTAVRQKNLQMAQFLLDQGANLNLDEALQTAVRNTDLQMAQLLLEHGANPDRPFSRWFSTPTILEYARRYSSPEVVQLLESAKCRGAMRDL